MSARKKVIRVDASGESIQVRQRGVDAFGTVKMRCGQSCGVFITDFGDSLFSSHVSGDPTKIRSYQDYGAPQRLNVDDLEKVANLVVGVIKAWRKENPDYKAPSTPTEE